jgi:hypothetical protein
MSDDGFDFTMSLDRNTIVRTTQFTPEEMRELGKILRMEAEQHPLMEERRQTGRELLEVLANSPDKQEWSAHDAGNLLLVLQREIMLPAASMREKETAERLADVLINAPQYLNQTHETGRSIADDMMQPRLKL